MTNHEICYREMYEEKSHFVSASAGLPFLHQLVEGDGVEGQTNGEQDRVGNEGDDLGLSKLHVVWQGKVCRN